MDFLESLGAKISQAGNGVSQRYIIKQGVSALNSQIAKLEKDLAELHYNLGVRYYSLCGSDPHPELATFCESIAMLNEQIDTLQNDLDLLRATTICRNCGANLKEGSAFCSVCGTKVPQLPGAAGNACSNCGAAVDPSSAFCTNCGTPIRSEGQPASSVEPGPRANICPQCGKQLRPGAGFCSGCGYRINS